MSIFKGVGTALVTPYNDNGIDFESFEKLVESQISAGIDALIFAGTTGETATMSDAEHKSVMDFAVKVVNKRVPVIVGTGSNDTNYGLQLSQYAEKAGVDGLLMVTPYYNKTTQLGAVKHYEYIADNVNIPIILYNVPSRTGFSLSVDTVVELSKHKNIVGLKEASGDIGYVAKVCSMVPSDFYVYSGNDDMVLPIMSLGGMGSISVLSNVLVSHARDIVFEYLNGNTEKAKEAQLKVISFVDALFIETNPIPIKTCMNILGQNMGKFRLPLYEMSEENKKVLVNEMKKIGLTK